MPNQETAKEHLSEKKGCVDPAGFRRGAVSCVPYFNAMNRSSDTTFSRDCHLRLKWLFVDPPNFKLYAGRRLLVEYLMASTPL